MASVKKVITKGGQVRWKVRWRDPRGDEQEKWFARKTAADDCASAVETDMARGEYIDPKLAKTKVAEYMAEWRAGRTHLAPKTLATEESLIANHIEPVFGHLSLGALRRSDLTKWISGLMADGYSSATIHKIVTIFSACLESAADDRLISRSPAHNLKLPSVRHQEKRFLTHEEVVALADTIDPRYRALVFTGAYAGLRLQELAGLRVSRLDLLRRSLQVEETVVEVNGKLEIGGPKTERSQRIVILPRLLVAELEGHLATFGTGDGGWIFPAPAGGPLRERAFRSRVWQPAVQRSVGEPCTPHSLRHTAVAWLIAEGVHVETISRRMGHSSVAFTLSAYGHLMPGLDQQAADALDQSSRGAAVGLAWGQAASDSGA